MSDLSILVNVIERIERTRQVQGAPLQSKQLERQALEFYQSQGIEVDHQLVEAACRAEMVGQRMLPASPAKLPLGAPEKRFRYRMLSGVGVCAAIGVASVVFDNLPLGLSIFGGALSAISGVVLFIVAMAAPHDFVDDRALVMWQDQLKTATTAELLILCQHPQLREHRARDVQTELHSRGLSPTGQPLLS